MFRGWPLVVALVLIAACRDDGHGSDGDSTSGGSGSDTMIADVDYATMIQPVFNTTCTCHLQGPSGTMVATTLTLNMDVSYGQLVGTPSTELPSMARIEPGDLEASYLWHKINATQLDVGGSGTEMPQGLPRDEALIELFHDWILGGAMP